MPQGDTGVNVDPNAPPPADQQVDPTVDPTIADLNATSAEVDAALAGG
jgi:hypothetical protein